MSINIYLDPQTTDFVLDESNNLRLTTDETEYFSQKIENTLKMNLGEYFLDKNLGVPYWGPNGKIMKKSADLNEVQDLLIIAIVGIEGINNVEKFNVGFEPETRTYAVTVRIMTDSGVSVETEINV